MATNFMTISAASPVAPVVENALYSNQAFLNESTRLQAYRNEKECLRLYVELLARWSSNTVPLREQAFPSSSMLARMLQASPDLHNQYISAALIQSDYRNKVKVSVAIVQSCVLVSAFLVGALITVLSPVPALSCALIYSMCTGFLLSHVVVPLLLKSNKVYGMLARFFAGEKPSFSVELSSICGRSALFSPANEGEGQLPVVSDLPSLSSVG